MEELQEPPLKIEELEMLEVVFEQAFRGSRGVPKGSDAAKERKAGI